MLARLFAAQLHVRRFLFPSPPAQVYRRDPAWTAGLVSGPLRRPTRVPCRPFVSLAAPFPSLVAFIAMWYTVPLSTLIWPDALVRAHSLAYTLAHFVPFSRTPSLTTSLTPRPLTPSLTPALPLSLAHCFAHCLVGTSLAPSLTVSLTFSLAPSPLLTPAFPFSLSRSLPRSLTASLTASLRSLSADSLSRSLSRAAARSVSDWVLVLVAAASDAVAGTRKRVCEGVSEKGSFASLA